MCDQWYRSGEAFMLVYSIVSHRSFEDIKEHYERILSIKSATKGPMVLVGNKSDKEVDRQVTTQEGKDLAQTFKIPFFEASAKDRINVDESFYELIRASIAYEDRDIEE